MKPFCEFISETRLKTGKKYYPERYLEQTLDELGHYSAEGDIPLNRAGEDRRAHYIIYRALKANEKHYTHPVTGWKHTEETVGARTHHVVMDYDQDDDNAPDVIKRISDHLKLHNVKHEISTSEDGAPAVYVPVDQRDASHIKESIVWKGKVTAGDLRHMCDGYLHGSWIVNGAMPHAVRVGGTTHHKITPVGQWYHEGEPHDYLSSELTQRDIKHEIAKDEHGTTSVYVPKDQT